MGEFRLSLPLYITTGVRKKVTHYLNFNRVLGMHFQVRNQVKRLFTEQVLTQLYDCPKFENQIKITYTVYKPSRRRYDVMNVVAIIDKFFQDALVVHGKIEDDDYKVVPMVTGIHGGIDKENARVDVLIEEV